MAKSKSKGAGRSDADEGAVALEEPMEDEEGVAEAFDEDGFHGELLNLADLKEMSISKLTQIAKNLGVPGATGMRKQDLIFQILN